MENKILNPRGYKEISVKKKKEIKKKYGDKKIGVSQDIPNDLSGFSKSNLHNLYEKRKIGVTQKIATIGNKEEAIKSEIVKNLDKKVIGKLTYDEHMDKIDTKHSFNFDEYTKRDGQLLDSIKKENHLKINKIKNINYDEIDRKYTISRQKRKRKKQIMNFIKIAVCLYLLVLIYKISPLAEKIGDIDVLTVFSNEGKNNDSTSKELNIAVENLDKDNNFIVDKINKYSYQHLISIDEDYGIKYELLEAIDKIDYHVYNIKIKEAKYVEEISNKLKEDPKFGVKRIDQTDANNIIVTLNNVNPYFVYNLKDIFIEGSSGLYKREENGDNIKYLSNGKLQFNTIDVINYDNKDDIINDFKNSTIDMFFTSKEDELRMIGRYDYKRYKYRTGESYFLLFNSANELLDKEYIRKVILYGINRNEIANNISRNFTEVIDIPYISSEVTYKYDNIASENLLRENGNKKVNGIYHNAKGEISFNLLVNEDDIQKVKIADEIKRMLENIGIRINIEKASSEEVLNKVSTKDYDMVLATVYLNESADISFLYDYININENMNRAIAEVNNCSVENLALNVRLLQEAIQKNVACVGILAKTSLSGFTMEKSLE